MDSSKSFQWQLACQELNHVRTSLRQLLRLEEDEEITLNSIIMLCLGPKSKTGRFLCDKVGLTEAKYLRFMATLCIQASYRLSVTQLYHDRLSLLKTHAQMDEGEYVGIWKTIAEKRQLPETQMSTNR